MNTNEKQMTSMEEWKSQWHRFELTTDDDARLWELRYILDKSGLSRYELAVIVAGLRVRDGFSLKDFRI